MKNFSRVKSSWYSVLFTAVFLGVAQLGTIFSAPQFPGSETHNYLRVIFSLCTVLLIGFMFSANRKNTWTLGYSRASILILWLATFVITVIFHVQISKSGLKWFPLPSLKYYFVALSTLASGTYFINFMLMMGFGVMGLVMYHTLDFTNVDFVGTFEPKLTIYFFFISLVLLVLKFRDEIVIENLHRENAHLMALKQVARVFLSVRDRANTPIQTLQVTAALLKKRHPEDIDLIEALDRSTKKLGDMNVDLIGLESKIPWGDKELLSEKEIANWVKKSPDAFTADLR